MAVVKNNEFNKSKIVVEENTVICSNTFTGVNESYKNPIKLLLGM